MRCWKVKQCYHYRAGGFHWLLVRNEYQHANWRLQFFMGCLSADSNLLFMHNPVLNGHLPQTPLLHHTHTSNLNSHVITTQSDLELALGCCLWRSSSNTTYTCTNTGTYQAGSSAAGADCGAGGWGRWEAETDSEHGRFHWGALWLCGEECHRCHCRDLQSTEKRSLWLFKMFWEVIIYYMNRFFV